MSHVTRMNECWVSMALSLGDPWTARTHSYVWHDSLLCVAGLIPKCDTTHSSSFRDSCGTISRDLRLVEKQRNISIHHAWIWYTNRIVYTWMYGWHELREILMSHWPSVCQSSDLRRATKKKKHIHLLNVCIHTDIYAWHELREILMSHWSSICQSSDVRRVTKKMKHFYMPNACIHTETYVWHELREIMMTHWPSVCWLCRWMCHVTRRNESYTDERVTSHICVLSRHVFVSCESFTVHTHADVCHMHISTSHVRHDSLICAYGIWRIWYVHMAYDAIRAHTCRCVSYAHINESCLTCELVCNRANRWSRQTATNNTRINLQRHTREWAQNRAKRCTRATGKNKVWHSCGPHVCI